MKGPLRLSWRAFHLPKAGHAPEEYEDAVAGDPEHGRFALADGASESAFAGRWAQLLVAGYVETPGPWTRWLPAARTRWREPEQDADLPWYAEAKREEGAYAALLGVAFAGPRWRATAIGDCCLFQVGGERLLRSFPIHHAADFNNRPSLLGSRRRPGEPRARRRHSRGSVRPGEVVLLMTDALAQWFLTCVEAGAVPWQELQAFSTQEEFAQSMGRLREAEALRNDDLTLALIQVQDA